MFESKKMKPWILRGYKDLPWNEKRRKFVAKYFNTTLFPDVGTFTNDKFSSQHEMVEETPLEVIFEEEGALQKTPEVNNSQDQQRSDMNITQLQLKRWHRTNNKTFWTKVLNFARMHGIPIHGLATILKEQHQKRSMWRKRSASGNHFRDLFTGLLRNRGSSECFRYELSIKMKTGNMEDILNAIRQRLVSVGLGGGSLVPSIRHIKRATSLIMKLFVTICEPERTYFGFRVSLLKAVAFASLVLLQKTILKALKLIFGLTVAK